jgi:hypothetical protein
MHVSVRVPCAQRGPLTGNIRKSSSLCPIVYKIYPTLQTYLLLSPQRQHRIPKRLGRPLIVGDALILAKEHRFIEILCQVPSISIRHCPHCSNHAPEPTILHRSGQVQCFVSNASICQLCCVAGREQCKFGSRDRTMSSRVRRWSPRSWNAASNGFPVSKTP